MRGTRAEVEAAFAQWQADWQANPDDFMSDAEHKTDPPKTYGEGAARTLARYLREGRGDS